MDLVTLKAAWLPILKLWIWGIMYVLEPNAAWRDTYESSAEAMALSAVEHPLYSSRSDAGWRLAVKKTAAIYISVGRFESTFKPDAQGDCREREDNGLCKKGGTPHSFCFNQIHESNFQSLGTTQKAILEDMNVCMGAGARMMSASFSVCQGKANELDLLNHYAYGGDGCPDATVTMKGRHRMAFAQVIVKHFPLSVE